MAMVNGSQILARALNKHGVDVMFYIMGGPMIDAELSCKEEGIRDIDVRHEQAAAMMAHAYARLKNRPGVCMAASGPATTNLLTGVANAWADASPIFAIGGSSPYASQYGKTVFQEMDQVTSFKPVTKWCERALHPKRVPEMVSMAFRAMQTGTRYPAYLDMPGDVLYKQVEESEVYYPDPEKAWTRGRPQGDPDLIKEAVKVLAAAERPIIITGSGILWSEASEALQRFVETAGLPFYTTPQGRGVIPDDHRLSFLAARSTAFREADVVMVVGTRLNYVISHASPPRFSPDSKLIQVDIEPTEIGHNHGADVGIQGDARAVLEQLTQAAEGKVDSRRFDQWIERLQAKDSENNRKMEERMSSNEVPIHPLRLCKEVRDFLDRDAVLVVDGQEILNFGRQSIPTFVPGHRLNSGPFGTMGVGLPFGLGAKVAKPDKQVLVLHGDGSFGLNAMELDTAVRHKINVVTVVSLNGGWTADPDGTKPGRNLGYTRYDKMAEGLGCHDEYVEEPDKIRPALERAFNAGVPALVNVKTDYRARATTLSFATYST